MPDYQKLVRDRIPHIIRAKGESCRIRVLGLPEYRKELRAKLQEELQEYLEAADPADALEELADMLEVIRALALVHGSDAEQLEAIRSEKAEQRGGFTERVYLIDTD
ncbi:phosphoribosyl-ATP pyrophosphohydrolase [Paenibacillus sp. 1011MAR3C5]|uniref:nucleoside triphosphate pyrophosphohydrolase n=1 Tax=Paenibacillus sp. 1011MAR3C5 TaxID=1675787 RepID=UPI000E6C0A13|nr:nucleoside triphosphate pyrophosphohydrolase [Paenibacillus sp. 1011MAR3C5]RJE84393.1 phosphoribosyl-ATP pyrophosphohydrolase [Paenibacillus sp. 1011MAR3C5]